MTEIAPESVLWARRPDRLYRIRSCPEHDFYAGGAADGRQLLAGEWCPDLLVGLFDLAGNLVDTQYRQVAVPENVEQCLREWYGFIPRRIRVKRFRIAPGPNCPVNPLQLSLVGENGLAVAPFPLYWDGCYDDPPAFPTDDPDYLQMIRDYIEREDFILFWGNELFLNRNGEVVGS